MNIGTYMCIIAAFMAVPTIVLSYSSFYLKLDGCEVYVWYNNNKFKHHMGRKIEGPMMYFLINDSQMVEL